MRFTAVFLTGALAVLASAQSSSAAAAPSTTSGSAPAQTSVADTPVTKCIKACDPGDVGCTAKCIAVPNPNDSQANATTDCVAGCDQGNGSPSETEKYSKCVSKCISDNFFTASPPGATGGSGSGSGSGASGSGSNPTATGSDGSSPTGTSGSGSGSGASGSGSSSGSSPTSSSLADGTALHLGTSAAGLLSFLAAFIAL